MQPDAERVFAGLWRRLRGARRAAVLALAWGVGWGGGAYGEAAPRPNLVYILADDLGYGDVGFTGQRQIRTPHIDRLAAEGMIFHQHYAGATVCTPSRAALMTGRHTGHVHCDRNSNEIGLLPEEVTIAEVLKKAGYQTQFVGKWGLGGGGMTKDPVAAKRWPAGTGALIPGQEGSIPTRQGFDASYGYLNQSYAHLFYPVMLWRNDTPEPIALNASDDYAERKAYAHDLLETEALTILNAADGAAPLYLQLSFTIPHRDVDAPAAALAPYAGEPWPEKEKIFAAMVTHLDATVGRILDAVDANPALAPNTLVIFTSDNGPHGEDGHSPYFFDSNGPFRGMKRDLYEGGIRVPTAVRWKGTVTPGTSSDHVSAFWDVLPTAAELAGVKSPADVDGISFAPTLTRQGAQQDHEFLYWEFNENGSGLREDGTREPVQRQAVRKGDWKLVLLKGGAAELYHLADDPGESKNLAEANPEKLAELRSIAEGIDPDLARE